MLSVIIGNACIKCFSAADDLCQCLHGLLKRCLRIHAVMIKNVHILKTHSFQALIQTRQHIFSASPVPIRTIPHQISCLRADDQFISVRSHLFFQNTSKMYLCASRLRPVIVRHIKMGDSMIKCRKTHPFHILKISSVPEIMPQSK